MSLATCILKAGKALDKRDSTAIRDIQSDYMSDGMTSTEAAKKAIDDFLGTLNVEREGILKQIKAEGGDIRSVDNVARSSKRGAQSLETKQQTVAREKKEALAQVESKIAAANDVKIRFNISKKQAEKIKINPQTIESISTKFEGAEFAAMKDQQQLRSERTRNEYVKDAGSSAGRAFIEKYLRLMPLRALPDFAEKSMTAVKNFIDINNKMQGLKFKLLNELQPIVKEWKDAFREDVIGGQNLADVINASTLVGANPSVEFESKINTDEVRSKLAAIRSSKVKTVRQKNAIARMELVLKKEEARHKSYTFLKGKYDSMGKNAAMTEKFQNIYKAALAKNELSIEQLHAGLVADVKKSQSTVDSKGATLAILKKQFEAAKLNGPYFHLGRDGLFFAAAKDKETGDVLSYTRFQTATERDRWIAKWGDEVTFARGEVSENSTEEAKQVSPSFVAKVEALVDDKALQDKIWQLYLQTLPQMSARHAFIHRKGRLGFSGDAMQSFVSNQFKNAHLIAKLTYGREVKDSLRDVEQQARGQDSRWAIPLSNELKKRHAYMMNPPEDGVASMITGLGFHWFLGMNPSTALINLTQTWILGAPVLAAAHGGGIKGYTAALAELGRATKDVIGTKKLSEDEAKAFKIFSEINLFETTRASDAIGVANKGAEYYSRWHNFAEWSAFMFHKAEVLNRESTALAAYRMARERKETHEQAILSAEKLTWDAHLDYSNVSRPPIMQQGVGRVAFMFKNYSVGIGYRLGRDAYDSMLKQGLSKQERKEAATRLVGALGMTVLMAGLEGMPMMWTVLGIATMFSDEDEPFDVKGAIRSTVTELTGSKTASNVLMDGPVNGLLGLDMSSRAGLSSLWYRDINKDLDASQILPHIAKEASGAFFGGFLTNAARGWDDAVDGRTDWWHKILPTTVKNAVGAYDLATEGFKKRDGTVVYDPEDFGLHEIIGKAMGAQPSKIALEYKRQSIISKARDKISKRRENLRQQYYNAIENSDRDKMRVIADEIEVFNSKQKDHRDKLRVFKLQRGYIQRTRSREKTAARNTTLAKPDINF